MKKKICFVCETTYNVFLAIVVLYQLKQKDDIETKLFNIFNDGLEVDDEI